MMTARLFVTLALVLGAVTLGELVAPGGRRLYVDATQLLAGAGAAWVCLIAARGRTGVQRRWRLLAFAGLTGVALMRLLWVVAAVGQPPRAVPSPADIGFLILPICLFFGLLSAANTRPRPVPGSALRDQIALVLDSVLIAGSLLALAWSVIPERVYRWAGEPPIV